MKRLEKYGKFAVPLILLVFVVIPILLTCKPPVQEKFHDIIIKLENNRLSVTPDLLIADIGDKVRWRFETGNGSEDSRPFMIYFTGKTRPDGKESPFGKRHLEHKEMNVHHPFRTDVERDVKFKYMVIVCDTESGQFYIVDPDIRVRP